MKRQTPLAHAETGRIGLYTPAERQRRDQSRWTLVQGVLAPIQVLACLVSIVLIQRFLLSGQGETLAHASVIIKIGLLYTIMVTGAIWEREVFGQYLFAPAFFWEDVVSMGVIVLHTAYLIAWWTGWLAARELFFLALLAYLVYGVNAAQFLLKLRAARLQAPAVETSNGHRVTGAEPHGSLS